MTILRSAIFNVWFFGLTIVVTLIGTVLRLVAPHKILPLAQFWARAIVAGARVICGIRLCATGLDRLPPGPCLIAARHQSAYDALVWLILAPRVCYVVKRELVEIPLFGPLIAATGMIAVDREGGGAAMRALLREADRAVAANRQIVIFPEGTRAPGAALLPLQPGIAALAARTGLPVHPAVTDAWRVWGRRAFRKTPGTVHIVILPPIEAGLQRDALMNRLRAELEQDPGSAVAAVRAGCVDKSVG